ncbi:kinase-like domain-containing protein, partial [Glomus cerebriforme]
LMDEISKGLKLIHNKGLVHRDLHPGNILLNKLGDFVLGYFITDLGQCRPANEQDNSKIYGVLPYLAPEVLKGGVYTQASDIYSFGIIAYEAFASLTPYHGINHDEFLVVEICKGLRPDL